MVTIGRCHRKALEHLHPGMVLHYNDDDHRCIDLDDQDLWDLIWHLGEDGSAGGLSAVSVSGYLTGTAHAVVLTVSPDTELISQWWHGRPVRLEPTGGEVSDALRLKLRSSLN